MSDQPLVSIILLAYKQEQFVRAAVRSAFAQDYNNLEIILSDDASPDTTFDIMVEEARSYRGPHKLILNRNPVNFGLTGNLNRAVELASGELVVEQDGDDISLPTRTSRLVKTWGSKKPSCDLVFSDTIRIAIDGSALKKQQKSLPIVTLNEFVKGKFFIAGGCASAYSRSLFTRFGPLNPGIKYPDYALTFRALVGSGCAFVDEPLVYYRVHADSISRSESIPYEAPRAEAARWAKHEIPTAQDCLRVYDLSNRTNRILRWRLARTVALYKLEQRSSRGSRFTALGCVIWALGTGRLKTARKLFRRDVIAHQ